MRIEDRKLDRIGCASQPSQWHWSRSGQVEGNKSLELSEWCCGTTRIEDTLRNLVRRW